MIPDPASDAFLQKVFSPWTNCGRILAAVSGGPDSMALLHMLMRWRELGGSPQISAATVDHNLRPQAKAEAAAVKLFADRLTIDHTTLVWCHDELSSRLQERARDARYELLAAHASSVGADVLMTAHHADDQAETILFRLIRGSGLRGLSGMVEQRRFGPIIIGRPLLALRKQDLITYCQSHSIDCCEDPSNTNLRFARSRMRNILPEMEKEGLGAKEWARFGRRIRRADNALTIATERAGARLVTGTPGTGLEVDFAGLNREPEEIALRVLIATIGQFDPGGQIRLERAENLLGKLQEAKIANKTHGATLGKARISMNSKGILTVRRQAQRRRGQRTAG
jgi:tRNA(Ile)-lysidine synthase